MVRFTMSAALAVALAAGTAAARADETTVAEIIRLTNAERAKQGLPALTANDQLNRASQDHTDNMAKQDHLAHELDGKGPGDRMKAAGYSYGMYRENVAMGQRDAAGVVAGWMSSPGHRKNILSNDVTEIGVGVSLNAAGRPYYCQKFAQPRGGNAPPAAPAVVHKEELREEAEDVVNQVNEVRAKNNVGALKTSEALQEAAQAHAEAMAKAKKMLDLPDLKYDGAWAGQYGSGEKHAGDITKHWTEKASDAALQGGYTEIGVGIAEDENGTSYYCYLVGKK